MMRRLTPAVLLVTLVLTAVPAGASAATRTINFDDFTAPANFNMSAPLTDRYAALGVRFAGPAPGSGGAVLDVSAFPVTGESPPNALAFDGSQTYPGGGTATGPETIAFATPIHSASIHVGQSSGGTVRLTGFDGTTAVSTNFQTSQTAVQTLTVAAERMTSLRLEYTGSATVWDDLTWGTAPVSGDDAFTTREGTTLVVPAAGVLGNDGDADGDHLSAALRRGAANGNVELRPDGSFTYIPRAGFSGVDTFTYRANDGTGHGNDATVAITVQRRPTLLSSTVSIGFDAFPKFTKVTALRVNELPKKWKVVVTCKTKKKKQQRKGCPYKSKTFKSSKAKSKLKLFKPFKKKKLPVGTRVRVTITATGFIGKQFTYTIRKSKRPKSKRLCIPPGGKPGKCK
jgi:hypothetical protein